MKNRLMRREEVQQTLGLSRSAIYSMLDEKSKYYDPAFPRPISLGTRAVAWVEAEIQSWIASRIACSRENSGEIEQVRKATITKQFAK